MADLHPRKTPALPAAPVAPPGPLLTLRRTITLMKPVTWFAPTWAFLCGAIASGMVPLSPLGIGRLVLGMLMAGPILVGMSQVVNDYCDRDVDAINEPHRLIPSGLVSLPQVIVTTIVLTLAGMGIAMALGGMVVLFVGVGLACALSYSMHPLRFKRNGWVGNALVAISYEGLAWLAGHSAFGALSSASVAVALFYSLGAHGIMTINDFKSIDGDRRMHIHTIPVLHGPRNAALIASATMDLAQVAVMVVLFLHGASLATAVVGVLLAAQVVLQVQWVRDPVKKAVFYSAFGVLLFVWGMMAAAIGL